MRLALSALTWGAIAVGVPAAAVELRSSRGPVDVVVRLSPESPLIGDVLNLELEVRADEGVELLMPEFGEALDRFVILDFSSREDLDDEGRTRAVQHYVLEPPFSGSHAVPPLLVEFIDRRPGAKPSGSISRSLRSCRAEPYPSCVRHRLRSRGSARPSCPPGAGSSLVGSSWL
jgi:hypothetical protein